MQQVLVVAESAHGVPAGVVVDLLAAAWRERHPDDEVTTVALSDGGPGLLEAIARVEDTWLVTEVAGPLGHPVEAGLLLRPDGSAVVEAARAGAPDLAPEATAPVLRATTHGVGELVDAAREAGARRVLIGVGGVAAVDGGAGALTGMGFRLRVDDGSGLKIGSGDLARVAAVEPGWSADWSDIEVVVLTDAARPLAEAAEGLPPGTRLGPDDAGLLTDGLARWGEVAGRDLAAAPLALRPGAGAGGGLAFGLAAALGGDLRPAIDIVWDLQDGPATIPDGTVVVAAVEPDGAGHEFVTRRVAGSSARVHLVPVDAIAIGDEVEDDELTGAARRALDGLR